MKMKKFLAAIVLASLSVAMASGANASLVTQSLSFTNIPENWTTPQTQSFSLFDTNQGVLNSVNVMMSFTGTVNSMTVSNNLDMEQNFWDARARQDITATVTGAPSFATTLQLLSDSRTGVVSNFGSVAFTDIPAMQGSKSASVGQDLMSLFSATGGGSSQMKVYGPHLGEVLADDVGVGLSWLGTTNGTITLAYDYTPNAVPIPAAAWLLGSGIAGIAVLRRRMQK